MRGPASWMMVMMIYHDQHAHHCGHLDHHDHLEVVDLAALLLHSTPDVVQFRLVNLDVIRIIMTIMTFMTTLLFGDGHERDLTFLLHSATSVSASLPVLSIL